MNFEFFTCGNGRPGSQERGARFWCQNVPGRTVEIIKWETVVNTYFASHIHFRRLYARSRIGLKDHTLDTVVIERTRTTIKMTSLKKG